MDQVNDQDRAPGFDDQRELANWQKLFCGPHTNSQWTNGPDNLTTWTDGLGGGWESTGPCLKIPIARSEN